MTLGYVTPTGTEQVLRNGTAGQDATRVQFVDGYAVFDGLYINVAGLYELQLWRKIPELSAFASAYSDEFTVAIGEAYEIKATRLSGEAGGTPFSMQPQIAIYDEGGNVITSWNTGMLVVSIMDTEEYPGYARRYLEARAQPRGVFYFGGGRFQRFVHRRGRRSILSKVHGDGFRRYDTAGGLTSTPVLLSMSVLPL